MKIRINTASSTPNTNSVGTGNYSNNALYFFRRGGTNQPFNGWDFGSFIVDRTPTTDEITAAEAWLNHFVGAY